MTNSNFCLKQEANAADGVRLKSLFVSGTNSITRPKEFLMRSSLLSARSVRPAKSN